MNTMLNHTTDGESRGEGQRVSNLQSYSLAYLRPCELTYPLLKHTDLYTVGKLLCNFNFGFLYLQLELCGGLTPISERSARASCDDNDSHTQASLLAEAADGNTKSYIFEDSSIIQPCYTTTVRHTTKMSISEKFTVYASCIVFVYRKKTSLYI